MTPRISIVTISFNQAPFLERAICSVLDQEYPNVEYIVVDPGSTDGSRDIIEKYRSRISKVILEPDKGPANGLNKGFAVATGEIFGYINSDDAYLPGALSKAASAFQNQPEADVIYGHSYIVDREGNVVRRSRSVPFSLQGYAYGRVVVMQQSTFFRRSAFGTVGGFNEENRSSWDGELLVDLALSGARLEMVNQYWSLFAIYPGSITASVKYNERYLADHARMFRTITGREHHAEKRILFSLARAEKWIKNPLVPWHRIIDKAFGCHKLSDTSTQ